MINLSVRLVC